MAALRPVANLSRYPEQLKEVALFRHLSGETMAAVVESVGYASVRSLERWKAQYLAGRSLANKAPGPPKHSIRCLGPEDLALLRDIVLAAPSIRLESLQDVLIESGVSPGAASLCNITARHHCRNFKLNR